MVADEILIRPWRSDDSVVELTALLHRCYAPLAAIGLNFTAAAQEADVTKRRIDRGECFVATLDGRIIGTITLYQPGRLSVCDWYSRPGTAVFAQFAVEPARQGKSIGSLLLRRVEERARALGAFELAFDTAEPATELIAFYARRGYRAVDHIQWEGKTYRSVVMSKSLGAAGAMTKGD